MVVIIGPVLASLLVVVMLRGLAKPLGGFDIGYGTAIKAMLLSLVFFAVVAAGTFVLVVFPMGGTRAGPQVVLTARLISLATATLAAVLISADIIRRAATPPASYGRGLVVSGTALVGSNVVGYGTLFGIMSVM